MTELDAATAGLVRRLAQRVAALEGQTRDLGRASQARDRSVEGGAQSLYDEDDELRAVVGEQVDGSWTITTYGGPPPQAPSAPLVATFPGGATITWDGFDANDEAAWPINLERIRVHLSTMPGEPATLDTFIASIESPDGGAVSVAQPDDVTTYCTLVAVTSAGVESVQSLEVPVTGGGIPGGGSATAYPFYTDTPPLGLGAADAGRQWYDTDDGNRLYRWDGDTWEPVLVGPGGTTDDLLAGKRVPLDTAMELEWGIPNPQTAYAGTAAWELIHDGDLYDSEMFGSYQANSSLVYHAGVYYSLQVESTTYVNASGATKYGMVFTLVGTDGSARQLFTHTNAIYSTIGPMAVSLAKIGSEWVVVWGSWVDTDRAATWCRRFSDTTFVQVGSQWKVDEALRYPLAASAVNGSSATVLVLRYDASAAQYRIEARTLTDGSLFSTTTLAASVLGGAPDSGAFTTDWAILQGSFDFGAARTLIAPGDGSTVQSFNVAAIQSGESFPIPLSGLAWDGTVFASGHAGGWIRKSSAHTTTGTVWVSYAYHDTVGGGRSAAAPVSATGVVIPRRSGMKLPAAAIPPDTDESPAPDIAEVYAYTGATQPALASLLRVVGSRLVLEGAPAVLVPFVTNPFNRTANAPPTVSTFPTGAAGALLAELGGFILRGDSTGDWPQLRRMIEAAHRDIFALRGHQHAEYAPAELAARVQELEERVKRGIAVTGTLVAGTPVNIPVTFPVAYDAGTTPSVQLTIEGGAGQPINLAAHVNGAPTNTGFTIRAMRSSGTASFEVYWRAEA